jgi:pimeloyl-ACP methyl ester carboxylesterase
MRSSGRVPPGRTRKRGNSLAPAGAAEALGYDRIGIWGISGGGPYALGCAALLPDMVVAAAAVASLAPYGVEGFDFYAGMGESNVEGFQLFFSDPEASRLDLREGRTEILAATPEQFGADPSRP